MCVSRVEPEMYQNDWVRITSQGKYSAVIGSFSRLIYRGGEVRCILVISPLPFWEDKECFGMCVCTGV